MALTMGELIGIGSLVLLVLVNAFLVVFGYGKLNQKTKSLVDGQTEQKTRLKDIGERVTINSATLIALSEHVKGINGHLQEQGSTLLIACKDIGALQIGRATNETRIINLEHRMGSARTRSTDGKC
uniref:Uncharacterized protein n=1 Tax=viral metagenome TaxID=1070528 RepID=A0A6M3IYJ1_9ZZZZ